MRRALVPLAVMVTASCGGVHETRSLNLQGPLPAGNTLEVVLTPPFEPKYQNNSLCFFTEEPTPADPNRTDKVLSRSKGTYFLPSAAVWGADGRRFEFQSSGSGNAPKFCYFAPKEALPPKIARVTVTSPELFMFSQAVLSTQSLP